MNATRNLFLWSSLLVTWVVLVMVPEVGDAAETAVPSGNVTIPKPSRSVHWRIDYRYAGEKLASEGPVRPLSSDYVIGENVARKETTYSGATRETIYIYLVKGYELKFDPGLKKILIWDIMAGEPEPEQLFYRDYPGFDWVSQANLQGTVDAFGEPCFHFVFTSPDGPSREAWISVETGLPVAYHRANVQGRYSFLPPPSTPLALPAEYVFVLNLKLGKGPPPGQVGSIRK